MPPEISVIIPVYKVEKFLPQCLDSLKNQTFQNFEAICVDDGSPDNCGKILDDYARFDNRFKVIHKQNGGLSSARNAAIPLISAPYTMFLDSDDALHKQTFALLLRSIKETRTDVVWFDSISFTDDIPDDFPVNMPPVSKLKTFTPPLRFYAFKGNHFSRQKDKLTGIVWNKLYKTSIIKNTLFEENLSPGEDNLYTLAVMAQINSITHIPCPLYFYRINANSIMHTLTPEKINNSRKKELVGYLKLQNTCRNMPISEENQNIIKKYVASFFLRCILRHFYKDASAATADDIKFIREILTSEKLYFDKLSFRYRVELFYYLKIKPLFCKHLRT